MRLYMDYNGPERERISYMVLVERLAREHAPACGFKPDADNFRAEVVAPEPGDGVPEQAGIVIWANSGARHSDCPHCYDSRPGDACKGDVLIFERLLTARGTLARQRDAAEAAARVLATALGGK